MKTLIPIISKNLKLLIRSKTSALIVILAPLLLILLVGLAFDNTNTFGLTIGVHAKAFGPQLNRFLDQLAEQDFRIIRYDREQECVEDIKAGITNTCIVFPENLAFETNEQKEVIFYVDHSKINLVWMIMDTLNVHFGSSAREISKNLTGVLISKLDDSRQQLEGRQEALTSVKSHTESTATTAQQITASLGALDLSYNEGALPLSAAKEMLVLIRDTLSEKLDDAKKNVSSVKSGVSGDELELQLDSAITNIEIAKKFINAENQSLTHLGVLLGDVQRELENIKTRLAAADTARQSSVEALTATQQRMGQSMEQLAGIESTINSIIGEINSIKVTNPEAIAEPIVTDIRPVSAQQTYLNYLFPSLIVLVVMFIALLLGSTMVMMEKHSPAFFRNFITPTRDIIFVLGIYLTNMLLLIIQLFIILVIASFFFSAQILPSIPGVIGSLLLAGTFFTFAGMLIGYILTSEETATLASISTGSILLLLSDVILPLESMPAALRSIAAFNPFVLAEQMLREVVLFRTSLGTIVLDAVYLSLYSIALFLFIWGSQQFMSRHYVQKFMYQHHKRKRHEVEQQEHDHLAEAVQAVPLPRKKSLAFLQKFFRKRRDEQAKAQMAALPAQKQAPQGGRQQQAKEAEKPKPAPQPPQQQKQPSSQPPPSLAPQPRTPPWEAELQRVNEELRRLKEK